MTNSTTQHNEVWSSGDIRDVAISWLPDGRTLALANGQGELRLQARTGKVLWRRECDAAVAGLTVSPDGAWLAVLDREQVLVHQTSTGELHLRHHLDGQPRFVCWGPGSRQLAVASADGVAVLDTRTGSDTWPRLPSGFDSTFGEWPVEGRLVLGGREGQIIVWDPRDDSEGARFMAGREPVRSLCALGDPWPLAVAAGSSVGLWQVAESAAQVARLGHADEVTLMAGCPRHGLVATATASGLMLWQTRKTPAESVKLALQGTTLRSLAFALNTGELAVLGTDGGIRFYDTSFLRSVPAATASLPEASAMSLDAYAAKQAATVGQRAVPVVRSPKWWVPTGLPGATGNCLGCLGEPCEQNGQDYGRGVALFGEDRFVAAGCLDGRVRCFDLRAGSLVWERGGDGSKVCHIAVSADGARLATGTNAGGCFLLDSQTGAPLGQLPKQESPVVWSCWSPDARFLATHTVGGKLNVWDAQTRASLRELREAAAGQLGHNGLDWSVLGAIAAGRSRGGVLEVWDATQGSRRFEVSSATGRLISAAWSPDGRRLAAGTLQGELFQVTADGQREASRPKAHVSFLYCLAWSPDGRLIASGARDNAIRIWQADGLTKVEEFSLPDMGWSKDGPYILRMAWARNGAFLATNSKDDVVRLWDVRHLMPRPRSRVVVPSNWVPSLPDSDGHGLGLIRGGDRGADLLPELALSPDGGRMFAGYEDRTLGCWDLRSGSELWTYPQPVGSIVAVSPDGQRLAASGGSNDISIHETTAGRQLQVCRGHTDETHISCWSPDSRRLASSSDDHTVRIWDADSGQCLHVCSGHEEAIQALSWSEDGASIASGDDDDGAIRIWNAETGHLRATWQAHREVIWGLSWSPDSQALIAAYIDGRTLLLDARDGSVLRVLSDTIDSRCGACQPAWSPDGRYVACAFRNPCRQTRIWDTRTGQELPPPFEFPEEYSLSLAWSPNGAFLASSHEDNVFRFWDVRHLGVRTTVAALFRRSSEPLPTPLRDLLGAFIRLHGLGINAPLSLIADLLALVAGHPVDSPLRQLAPLLRPVAERRWPEAARLGLVAVVLHDVPLPGWPSPPDATADDLRQALTDALHGEPVDPDAAAAPLALLLKSCERLDVRLLDLLELIGPMALAADVGLALRLLPKIGAMPPLADRQRALLGVRSRVQGRPGCATGVAAGADRLIAGGVELGSLSAHRRHLLPTQLALPEWMLRVRHVRGELLFRPREAAEPPRQRPLVILLDVSPPVFGPVEATTRLAAHTAARAVLEAGLTAMLVTPTDTGPPMVALERPSDLAEIWTRRSFNPADEPRLLALAQALRAALPHEPGIPPLVLLLTHTWFGAEADLPALPHLRGLFVQHPGHPTPPVLAGRCERHLCLRPGDLTNLAQQLAEVLA